MNDPASPYGYLRTKYGLALRYGHWPYPGHAPKGTILILQGRSEYMEKYEETVAALHDRRLDVFSFDWRGQGLSDRMLPDREKGFVRHYGEYLEDLELIMNAVIQPGMRGELYLLAHSMGGHIGLRHLHRHGHLFTGVVLCAPMIDIITRQFPSFFARWLSRRQVAAGNPDGIVVGALRRTPFPERFRNNFWTSDRRRFERNRQRIKERPELSAAMVTYGWVAATYDSFGALKQAGRNHLPKIPLLFVVAERDRVVSNRAIRKFVSGTYKARLVVIKDARHEILQEADAQRGLFWQAFDMFIGQ